ncbi:MAG: MATE family efflux transporter [Christensenellaceae bacterium]
MHKKNPSKNFLSTDAPLKVVLKLAIPSMLAQFVNVLYSIVDRIYIGHMPEVGSLALAGAGICGPIVTLLSSFGTWIGLGGAPAMSIKMGEGDLKGARKILNNGAMMLAVMSVLLTAFVFALKTPLLKLFGAGGNIAGYASDYLSWYSVGTVFAVMTTGLNAYIVGQGHGKAGMATVCIGAVANIALDPLFIFTFGMGVKGAAIATVISQFFSALFTVLFLFSKKVEVRLGIGGYDKKIIGKILLLGFSPFIIIATDSVMILALNKVLRTYGGERADELISAATIMLSFMQIITLPLGGISGGTQPALSYNYGANRPDRVKKCEGWILGSCILYTVVMFLVARFAAGGVVSIFTDDAALKAESVRFIKIYTLMIIPLAFQYALVDGLTGLGIAPVAITLSLFRKLVLMLTLTLTLPRFFGVESVFYAEPVSDLVGGIVSTVVFFCLINKILKKRDLAVRAQQQNSIVK